MKKEGDFSFDFPSQRQDKHRSSGLYTGKGIKEDLYRLWRDAGFAVGAILSGVVADLFGLTSALWMVAILTALSGAVVAKRMYETRPTQVFSRQLP